jgi:pantoate--beta-alanine ligase
MGALHAGHASLIKLAAKHCDTVIVSIFVNPAQFGEGEDFDRYPRSFDADIEIAHAAGADYIFAPSVKEVYPNYPAMTPSGERLVLSPVARRWEGEFRPNHFEGVATVVRRLFDMVSPDKAYFGEKDYQQLRVIEDMLRELNLAVEILRCPTLRDENGLALSSRNRYLSAEELQIAQKIPQALRLIQQIATSGGGRGEEFEVELLLSSARAVLGDSIKVDYLALVEGTSLEPVEKLSTDSADLRALFAGYIGTTRLIDNLAIL